MSLAAGAMHPEVIRGRDAAGVDDLAMREHEAARRLGTSRSDGIWPLDRHTARIGALGQCRRRLTERVAEVFGGFCLAASPPR